MNIITILHIIVSILLVIGILMQQSGDGLGTLGGGSNFETVKSTRRGFDKFIFEFTIAMAVLFAALSVVSILS